MERDCRGCRLPRRPDDMRVQKAGELGETTYLGGGGAASSTPPGSTSAEGVFCWNSEVEGVTVIFTGWELGCGRGSVRNVFLIDYGCSRSMAVETERDIQSRRDGRRVHIGQCLVPSDRNQMVGKKLMTWPNGISGNEPTFRFLIIKIRI